jgi:hypothetical protein
MAHVKEVKYDLVISGPLTLYEREWPIQGDGIINGINCVSTDNFMGVNFQPCSTNGGAFLARRPLCLINVFQSHR